MEPPQALSAVRNGRGEHHELGAPAWQRREGDLFETADDTVRRAEGAQAAFPSQHALRMPQARRRAAICAIRPPPVPRVRARQGGATYRRGIPPAPARALRMVGDQRHGAGSRKRKRSRLRSAAHQASPGRGRRPQRSTPAPSMFRPAHSRLRHAGDEAGERAVGREGIRRRRVRVLAAGQIEQIGPFGGRQAERLREAGDGRGESAISRACSIQLYQVAEEAGDLRHLLAAEAGVRRRRRSVKPWAAGSSFSRRVRTKSARARRRAASEACGMGGFLYQYNFPSGTGFRSVPALRRSSRLRGHVAGCGGASRARPLGGKLPPLSGHAP